MSDSWLDILSNKGKELFSNYSTQFVDNLLKKETPPNVIVAPPAKSNLTADQIADGQRGAISGLQSIMPAGMGGYIGVIAIIGAFLVAALLMKKK